MASVEETFGASGEILPKLGREFLEASITHRDREQAYRRILRVDEREHRRAHLLGVIGLLMIGVGHRRAHSSNGLGIVRDGVGGVVSDFASRKSVRKNPGSTVVAKMPSGASSMANASVRPSTANLVAQ